MMMMMNIILCLILSLHVYFSNVVGVACALCTCCFPASLQTDKIAGAKKRGHNPGKNGTQKRRQ